MKKHYILFSFAAALIALMAVSCQKEQEVVTLTAVMNSVDITSKVYLNGYAPYWHNADQVYVNDDTYAVQAANGSTAQILNVVANNNGYRALFPASILTPGTSDISSNSSVPVTLPSRQLYVEVDGNQRVDVPMGAYTSDNTLQFYNLCSIVRVTVTNGTGADLPLTAITITAGSAYLSGAGTATITGSVNDAIAITNGSHSVTLAKSGNAELTTLGSDCSATFDVIVPHFDEANQVTIRVASTNGYQDITLSQNVTLGHNTITTVAVTATQLSSYSSANLVSGPTFNNALTNLSTTATAVRFEYCNSTVNSGTSLDTNSSTPIYLNLSSDGSTYVISTAADRIYANANCTHMFEDLEYLTTIDFGNGFVTDNTLDMDLMFYNCLYLTCLDLSSFNTENVLYMYGTFANCYNLASLDLSSFNTSSVTDMSNMFVRCYGLTSLDLSNFNTENVTNMARMFQDCNHLSDLDISSFNTSNDTNMNGLFANCGSLTTLDLSHFNTDSVTDMSNMFFNCGALTDIDLSSFNTSSVTTMSKMFYRCSGLPNLDLSNFQTTYVEDMSSMFDSCVALSTLTLSDNFTTANVTDMSCMFKNCKVLTSIDVSSFNTSSVTDMNHMFMSCLGLTTLDLSKFNTSNVLDMNNMMANCKHINTLYLYNPGNSTNPFTIPSGTGTNVDRMCFWLGHSASNNTCHIYCSNDVYSSLTSNNLISAGTSGISYVFHTY